jgi:hypothetical protein
MLTNTPVIEIPKCGADGETCEAERSSTDVKLQSDPIMVALCREVLIARDVYFVTRHDWTRSLWILALILDRRQFYAHGCISDFDSG